MSLELSNEDLRTLINLVVEERVTHLKRVNQSSGIFPDEHRQAAEELLHLRQRLASELARRDPFRGVREHLERVRELVERWQAVAPQVEGTPPDKELPGDVVREVMQIGREIFHLGDPWLIGEYRPWAEAQSMPSGFGAKEAT